MAKWIQQRHSHISDKTVGMVVSLLNPFFCFPWAVNFIFSHFNNIWVPRSSVAALCWWLQLLFWRVQLMSMHLLLCLWLHVLLVLHLLLYNASAVAFVVAVAVVVAVAFVVDDNDAFVVVMM